MNPYVYLLLAILSEIFGTAGMRASEGFTRVGPIIMVVVGYALSFYWMAVTMKFIPIGTVYAIWAGLGTAGTVAIGVWIWNERLDAGRIIGIVLIVVGVIVLQVFSKETAH
jgi:small multidrug resistance pump